MHLHHDTRPGLWHVVFGFGAGFGARAGLGEQRPFTPCCLVALSPVLCGTLDAPRQQPRRHGEAAAHDGTRSWPRGVQPHVAVSLLRPCTPAANGRTRTGTRRWFFRRPCHHHVIIISLSVFITPSSSSSSTSGAIVVMTTITNYVLTDHYDACICIMTHGQGLSMRYLVLARGLARAQAGLGEQRPFTPCCLVALSPVLCGTLDAPRQQPRRTKLQQRAPSAREFHC